MTSAVPRLVFPDAPTSVEQPALPQPDPVLVKVEQAAAMLGIGRTTTYALIASGELDVVHIGRLTRVPVTAIDDFVERLQHEESNQEVG